MMDFGTLSVDVLAGLLMLGWWVVENPALALLTCLMTLSAVMLAFGVADSAILAALSVANRQAKDEVNQQKILVTLVRTLEHIEAARPAFNTREAAEK